MTSERSALGTATTARAGSGRRWHWYWTRIGRGAVLVAVGACMYLSAALLVEQRPWFEDVAAPLDGTGFTRSPSRLGLGADLLSADHVEPGDVRITVIAARDGRPLVLERRIDFALGSTAHALRRALARGGSGGSAADGFGDVRVGCPRACRPAAIGQHDSTVILLARLASNRDADAERGQRALAVLRRRYAERVGVGQGLSGPVTVVVAALVAAGAVALLFAPFAAWQAWVARSAPRTPHRHTAGTRAARPPLVDVCPAADAARRRGRRLLAVEVGIFMACGIAASVDLRLAMASLVVAPVLSLHARRVRPGRRDGERVDRGPGLLTSGGLRLEAVALRGAALWLTALAWALTGIVVLAGPVVLGEMVAAPGGLSVDDGRGVGVAVLALGALAFILLGALTLTAAVARFARRLRGLAADRDHRRRPRPVILYLRGFDDDRRIVGAGGFGTRPATEIFSFRARVPYMEVIADALDHHGRVLSIAEPEAPRLFLPLGLSRERLTDRAWQTVVRTRMEEADLIVIAVSASPGLLWEVATATRQGLRGKVMLVVPPHDDDEELRSRWRASADSIAAAGGTRLPLSVDPAAVLAAQLSPAGVHRVAVGDRRDEYTYRAAIDACLQPSLPAARVSVTQRAERAAQTAEELMGGVERRVRERAGAQLQRTALRLRPAASTTRIVKLLERLRVRVERAGVAARRPQARGRGRLRPFVRRIAVADADDDSAIAGRLADLIEPLRGEGFALAGDAGGGMRFERRFRPAWALWTALLFFWLLWPLLALLVRRRAVIDVSVARIDGRRCVTIAGTATDATIALARETLARNVAEPGADVRTSPTADGGPVDRRRTG